VSFPPNSKLVASASYDETVRLWDSGTGALLQISRFGLIGASSPNGKLVTSRSDDKIVRLWD
ncbi:uncharacterized protein BDR25DRAFT_168785, partial [Lindgomyces ingoldianus]